ncbi:MAG: hypothetical protein ACI4EV_09950 [Lachnospiraceae bacterium]
MDSLKDKLRQMLDQGISISINMHKIHNPNAMDHYLLHDDANYMLDYMWDENGNFLQLNVNILECDKEHNKK